MQKITPHLWFDTQAVEAAEMYASVLPDSKVMSVSTLHDTPSGDTDIVSFQLMGQSFMAISAGPLFRFTPAISFLISCDTEEEVDAIWARLSEGGTALMPLDAYPFSARYGWTEDRFGLSWQVMLAGEGQGGRGITPTLMFAGDVLGKTEQAVDFYAKVFSDARVDSLARYGDDEGPDAAGTVKHAGFTLEGQRFAAMDSARAQDARFNESISFMVTCDSQEEIDRYWEALSAVPESEQCGWLKDRFGLSWQIVPSAMNEMMDSGTPEQIARVTEVFLQMKKFDIAELRRAYEGPDVATAGTS